VPAIYLTTIISLNRPRDEAHVVILASGYRIYPVHNTRVSFSILDFLVGVERQRNIEIDSPP
jgi:hypothetical protein